MAQPFQRINAAKYLKFTCAACGKVFFKSERSERARAKAKTIVNKDSATRYCSRGCFNATKIKERRFDCELLMLDFRRMESTIGYLCSFYPKEDEGDLKQEVRLAMLKAFEKAHSGNRDNHAFYRSHIAGAMRHWFIKNQYRRLFTVSLNNIFEEDNGISIECLTDNNLNIEAAYLGRYLYKKFKVFCRRHKNGFILAGAALNGMSFKEIAQAYGVSYAEIEKRHKAIALKFKEKFKNIIAEFDNTKWDEAEWG